MRHPVVRFRGTHVNKAIKSMPPEHRLCASSREACAREIKGNWFVATFATHSRRTKGVTASWPLCDRSALSFRRSFCDSCQSKSRPTSKRTNSSHSQSAREIKQRRNRSHRSKQSVGWGCKRYIRDARTVKQRKARYMILHLKKHVLLKRDRYKNLHRKALTKRSWQ